MRTFRAICLVTTVFLFTAASAASAAELNIQPGPPQLDVEVTAKCVGKDARFQVVNKGDRWPSKAEVLIQRVSDHSAITSRRLIMVGQQRISFKIAAKLNPGDAIGLFVNPLWYERPFKYDAEIICQ